MSEGMNLSQDLYNKSPSQQLTASIDVTELVASADDMCLIELLRNGNETAFVSLIDRYTSTMMHLAMIYVTTRVVAEEVVQETWMGVLEGLNRFEGRSSLKTWIFRILTNRAKTRAQREARYFPFSLLFDAGDDDAADPVLGQDRFLPADHRWAGHWVSFPAKWEDLPEERLLSQETYAHLELAINALSPNQREVIILRDVEGWAPDEICTVLGISEANQRVLLHRARAKVRNALEKYFQE